MASFVTNVGAAGLSSGGGITWGTMATGDDIRARLVATSATPTKDDANMGSNYTAIGTDQSLVNKDKTTDTTDDRIEFGNGDVALTWASVAAGSTIGWVVIYKYVAGGDANCIPIAVIDVTDTPTNGGNITYTESATDGLFYLQQ